MVEEASCPHSQPQGAGELVTNGSKASFRGACVLCRLRVTVWASLGESVGNTPAEQREGC